MRHADRNCAMCTGFSTRAANEHDAEAVKTAATRAAGGLGQCKVLAASTFWLTVCVNFDRVKDRAAKEARQRYVEKMMTKEGA